MVAVWEAAWLFPKDLGSSVANPNIKKEIRKKNIATNKKQYKVY